MPVDSIRGDRLINPPDSLMGDTLSRDTCTCGSAAGLRSSSLLHIVLTKRA